MSDVMNILGNIDGVQSVVDLDFKNLFNTADNYSGNVYDLESEYTVRTHLNDCHLDLDVSDLSSWQIVDWRQSRF